MRFAELFKLAKVEPLQIVGDGEVTTLTADSRELTPGQIFACMPFPGSDSHVYIDSALERGAGAIIVHSAEAVPARPTVPFAVLPSKEEEFGKALWPLCVLAFGDPTSKLRIVGVTGTNGKTTTAYLLRHALSRLDRNAAYLGTLGYKSDHESIDLHNTTPVAPELYALLARAVDSGIQDVALEVSSHALALGRVGGVQFDAAVFTNLSQDHLDYHGSMEEYEKVKKSLFTSVPRSSKKAFRGAVNFDDATGRRWADDLSRLLTYGISSRDAALRAEVVKSTFANTHIQFSFSGAAADTTVALVGDFNVANAAAAVAGLLCLGYGLNEAVAALEGAQSVPGRFQTVPNDRNIGVIVDFAHTPDALEKVLTAAKALRPKRLVSVFGCGGDRDRTKRPKMGRVSADIADFTIVTSDNPRTEVPASILKEIEAGIPAGHPFETIEDRKEAVFRAIAMAEEGDIVVIAGKGHEDYQIIGRTKFPMDDRVMAREALAAR